MTIFLLLLNRNSDMLRRFQKKTLALLLIGYIENMAVYQMNGKMVVRSKPSVKRKKATGQQKDAQNLFGEVM